LPTHVQNPSDTEQLDLFAGKKSKLSKWKTLRDAIGDLDESEPELLDFSPRKKSFLSLVPEGGNWRSLPENLQIESMGKAFHAKGGRSGWWRRLTYDLPSPTLITMPNHASTSLCHPIETRVLSVKEYARIQEFPDDWEFCGKISQKYTQIGNAVPTRLGEVAGGVVLKSLLELKKSGFPVKAGKTKEFRIIYIQSHVRTRKWYSQGKAVVWNNGNDDQHYAEPKTLKKQRKI
jgi:DNA (cytosine-5)-methyltransferase 1